MITLVSGVLMLCVLIVIHELGHFSLAKLFRVKVLTFSLGFGPRLWSRRRGETEYRLSAVPLGGYVQMLGEGTAEEAGLEELTEEDRRRAFAEQPLFKRFAIVAAGPLMNLALPFLILPLAYLVGVQFPAYLEKPACVGYVAEDSAAASAGFQVGDCITAMNGQPVETWQKANEALITLAGESILFSVENSGRQRTLEMSALDAGIEGLIPVGILPIRPAVIGAVFEGKPAEKAGLKPGDRIVEVGDVAVDSWYELPDAVAATKGRKTEVRFERQGQLQSLTLKPIATEEGRYLLGVAPAEDSVVKKFGLLPAIRAGADQALDLIELTLVFIKKLFTGGVSAKNIGGPITVFQFAGQAAQTDLSAVFSMLAFLSIQLGILNLLPIPVLDGGHLFFYVLELVFRKPLNRRAREVAQQIGLVLLILLMGLAFYNDIVRNFFGS